MAFLFHAVTYTNGTLIYWNIHFVDESQICAEDLSDKHLPVKLKIATSLTPGRSGTLDHLVIPIVSMLEECILVKRKKRE